jgi:uncharacterized protein (TIGR02246 family)
MDIAELLIREGVRDTIARYNTSGDQGDVPGLADCFTPDGTMAIKGRDPYVGRDAIVDGLTQTFRRDPDDARPALGYLHHSVTTLHFVDVTAAEVRTTAYFSVLTRVGLDHWGRYRDRLVPVDGRWLFALREIVTDGYGADSLFDKS